MWPASALLTGNGVAFVLRVPGTVHGDWWSLKGWWIFLGTSAGALLSKYVIAWRGEHVFNPSNIGLVAVFLILGRRRAEPLDFWWGPMSWWMVLALAIIVTGGFMILRRLKLCASRSRSGRRSRRDRRPRALPGTRCSRAGTSARSPASTSGGCWSPRRRYSSFCSS
jgi:Na+-transporting NADH:ubiquinone oxidoreductase, subunit NqrB